MPARSLLPLPHGRAGKVRAYVRFFIYTLQGRANTWPEVRRQAQRSCRLWSEPPRPRPGLPHAAPHCDHPRAACCTRHVPRVCVPLVMHQPRHTSLGDTQGASAAPAVAGGSGPGEGRRVAARAQTKIPALHASYVARMVWRDVTRRDAMRRRT